MVTVWEEISTEMKSKYLETFAVGQTNFMYIEYDDKNFGLIFCMVSLTFYVFFNYNNLSLL